MHITARMTELVQRYVTVHGRPPARITVGVLLHSRWLKELDQLRPEADRNYGDPMYKLEEFIGIPVEVCLEPIGLWDPGMIVPPKCPEPEPGSTFAPGFAARAGLL